MQYTIVSNLEKGFVRVKKRQSKEYYTTLLRKHVIGHITLSDKQVEECVYEKNK